MTALRKVLSLLTPRERRQAYLLVPVVIAMALAEVMGIAALAPFLSLIAEPEIARTRGILRWLDASFRFETDREFLVFVGSLTLGALVVGNAVLAIGNWALFTFGAMRNHTVSRRLLIRYLRQPYAFFLERNSASLANNVLQEVAVVIGRVVVPGLLAIAKAAGAFAILTYLVILDARVALLIGTALGGAYALVFFATRQRLARIGRDRVRVNQMRFVAATSALAAIKDLKVLGREMDAVVRFSDPSSRYAAYDARHQVLIRLPRYVLEAVALGGMIVVVLALVIAGSGPGTLLPLLGVYAFGGYRTLLALYDVFQGVSEIRYGLGALEEVHEASRTVGSPFGDLDRPPERSDARPLPFERELRLEHVDFAYPTTGERVLRRVDLEVPRGASVALVGPSGSGKTTLVDILVGLLAPAAGRIVVDGEALDDASLRSWQRALGYVPQEVYLIDDTVAQNIALGVPRDRISMASVRRAARAAQIDAFIEGELEHGYDTQIGERGARLSGGQRQRLAIARALYHAPAVLVLDEATSALDADTERRVFASLREIRADLTLIAIAHRISTVRGFDEIFVLEDGEIAAHGTHEELMRGCEPYRRLAGGTDDHGGHAPDTGSA